MISNILAKCVLHIKGVPINIFAYQFISAWTINEASCDKTPGLDKTYAGTVITDLVSGRANSQPSAFDGFKQHQILAVCAMGKY